MAYEMRTLATLGTQARQFFTQAVQGAIVRLWANTFTVFGKVFALLDFEHEQRRAFLYAQLFASTAQREWLIRHGYELGLTIDPGNSAIGTVTVAAEPGTEVPTNLPFVRADGATYTTIGRATATGNSVTLPIQSDEAGAIYNVDAGDTLTLATGSAPIGLGTIGTVDVDGLTGGSDPEDLETFRARVLFRKRNPPQGGSIPDYQEWVGEALATARVVWVDSFRQRQPLGLGVLRRLRPALRHPDTRPGGDRRGLPERSHSAADHGTRLRDRSDARSPRRSCWLISIRPPTTSWRRSRPRSRP